MPPTGSPTRLATPFAISPKKVLDFEKLVLEHRSKLNEVEEKIAAIGSESIPESFTQQRKFYLQDLKERARPLSPIQSLPQDALLYILEICYSQMSEQDFKDVMPNVWPPNIFMQVCRMWREVTAASGLFWDRISLPFHKLDFGDATKLSSFTTAVSMWLENSKQRKLKLYIYDWKTSGSHRTSSSCQEKLLQKIWKLLRKNSARWHTMEGSIRYRSPLYKLVFGSDWSIEEIENLNIENVSLELTGRYGRGSKAIESTSLIRARSLHFLDLSKGVFVDKLCDFLDSWTSLTTLCGLQVTPYEVYYTLKKLPQLKKGVFLCARFERRDHSPTSRVFDEAKALEKAQSIESQLEEVEFVSFPSRLLNPVTARIRFPQLSSLTLKNRRCRHAGFGEDCYQQRYSIITDYGPKGLTSLHLDHVCMSGEDVPMYLESLVDVTHLTLSYSFPRANSGRYHYRNVIFDDQNFLQEITPQTPSAEYRPRLPKLQSLRCDFLPSDSKSSQCASECFEVQRIKEMIRSRRHPESSLCGVADLQELSFRCRVSSAVEEEVDETNDDIVRVDLASSLSIEGLDVEGLKAQGEFLFLEYFESSQGFSTTRSERHYSDYEVYPGGSVAEDLPDEEFFELPRPPPPPQPSSDFYFDLPSSPPAPNLPEEDDPEAAAAEDPSSPCDTPDREEEDEGSESPLLAWSWI
ncbi:hypothetical protein MD484_g7225, partial [Candolleomyces efflorescens]